MTAPSSTNTRMLSLAGLGAGAFLLAGHDQSTLVLVRLTICGATLAAVSASDLAEHRIPNRLVLPAAVACAVLSVIAGVPASDLLAGGAIVVLLALVSLTWPRALGMGDVKLALLVLAGLDGSAIRALVLGLILAALAGASVIARHGISAGRTTLPLAPFIAAGSLLALLT
jgi:leader peptidase (prepilin peptidase)/N-methyltransferase